MVPSYLALVTL